MDDLSGLKKLGLELQTRFGSHLEYKLMRSSGSHFLYLSSFQPETLTYVPAFHLVIVPLETNAQFRLRLLTFHGRTLAESKLDLSNENSHQFHFLQKFILGEFKLCKGQTKKETNFEDETCIFEPLEDRLVFRSLNCNYIAKESSNLCQECQKFEVNGQERESSKSEDDSEDFNFCDQSENDGEEQKGEIQRKDINGCSSSMLQKLKSLNLPVTVSLSLGPAPAKSKSEEQNQLSREKPVETGLKTVVVEKRNRKEPVIELAGKTVTNRCNWCAATFHRLYLFKDHLKVCPKVPQQVHKGPAVRRTKDRTTDTKESPVEPFTFKKQCPVCLHVYTNHARYVHDMRQHRKQLHVDLESPVECPTCKATVEKRLLLNEHFAKEHPDPEAGGICCECFQTMPPVKLKYHFYYKHHMQQVDKKHLCPLCGKSLIYAYQLQVHMAVHHKGEMETDSGGVLMSNPAAGVTGVESDVMCDQCGKVFAHRALLCVHVRKQHIRSRAFPCEFCSKGFSSPGALMEHLGSVHLKLKPFKCRECDYLTSHKNNIYKHFQQHHGRKGNSDDVETIGEVMKELKQYLKKSSSIS